MGGNSKTESARVVFLVRDTPTQCPLILMKYHENILKGFRVMVCTKFYNFGRLWEITPEPSRLELSFLHTTLLPNALYNLTKFHENSSKGIGVMGRTRFCLQTDGQTDARAIAISPEPFGRGIKM